MTIAYLDGTYQPLEEVRISPLDRGFLFADGVYEVVPVYAGRLFRAGAHLERLARSLAAVRIRDPLDPIRWRALLEDLVARNGGGDQAVYLQVTRGVAPREHGFPVHAEPTVFAMTRVLGDSPEIRPLDCVTRPDIRWGRCDIKSVSLLPNVLVRQEAADAAADEAIMLRDGMLTEGSATNVFVVQGERVRTPPKSAHILGGITRDLVIELLADTGVPCREEPITQTELRAAAEIWVTSSTKEVAPVVRLDGEPVGDGVPGPRWEQVQGLFQDFKQRLVRGEVD